MNTQKMMMRVEVCIEPNCMLSWTQGCDEPKFRKQPKGPINGIKRYRGKSRLHAFEDRLGTRVFPASANLSKHFESLVGDLDPSLLTSPLKVGKSVSKLALGQHRKGSYFRMILD